MAHLPPIINIREHQVIETEYLSLLRELGIEFKDTDYLQAPSYLGVKPNGCASYYIGADWLHEEKSIALAVLPKIENIDFVEMYMTSLQFDLPSKYFSNIYHIDFGKKTIETDLLKDQLTPLLILHFLNVVKRIVKHGLKHDYVAQEKNLQSRIKGRIKIAQNDRLNVLPKRYDRIYCEYNEYIVDTPANRLLKKALLFSKKYIYLLQKHKSYEIIRNLVNEVLSHFECVSNEIEIYQVREMRQHKIYKDYNEGLNLAKMILQRFSYSLQNINSAYNRIPPFWIDMSRLYEVYVYSLLYRKYGDTIQFQIAGSYGSAVDFIKKDEQIIIDTKYKPKYNDGNSGILKDVRQISGYARDNKILKELDISTNIVVPCIIIYPENTEGDDKLIESFTNENLLESAIPIENFNKFYKLSVSLPTLS